VYGLLIRDGHLTIANEQYKGMSMVKFPGGGMEFGESPQEALKREFKEELDAEINILDLFYLTDFFQRSAFDPAIQVLSIYYFVALKEGETVPAECLQPFIRFEQKYIGDVDPVHFTFPIDQHVAKLLKESWVNSQI
jgi:8-oxo-dGTP diphosphatase